MVHLKAIVNHRGKDIFPPLFIDGMKNKQKISHGITRKNTEIRTSRRITTEGRISRRLATDEHGITRKRQKQRHGMKNT